MEHSCRKCGCRDFYYEQYGSNIGLYCKDCGSWITWLSQKEVAKKERTKRYICKSIYYLLLFICISIPNYNNKIDFFIVILSLIGIYHVSKNN